MASRTVAPSSGGGVTSIDFRRDPYPKASVVGTARGEDLFDRQFRFVVGEGCVDYTAPGLRLGREADEARSDKLLSGEPRISGDDPEPLRGSYPADLDGIASRLDAATRVFIASHGASSDAKKSPTTAPTRASHGRSAGT